MTPRVLLPAVLAAALYSPSLVLAQGAPDAPAGAAELLEKARAEVAQLNYDGAIALFEQAEAAGNNSRETLVEIYRAVAEAHAALGRTDQAETSFRRLLALDPDVQLPAGASPKLTTPFEGASEFVKTRGPLKIECRRTSASAAEAGVVLTVASDPAEMIAAGRLLDAAGATVGSDVEGKGRITLAGDAQSCVALDAHRNLLAAAEVADAAPEPTTGAGTTTGTVTMQGGTSDGSRPLYARWWVWGGAAVLSGAVAIYYGVKLKQDRDDLDKLNEDSEMHFFEDALEIEERGDSHARNANIFLGITAALGAVSVGLLVYDLVKSSPEGESGSESATTASRARRSKRPFVTAGAVPGGGAAASLSLEF
ncbi:MAG TPA: tetratricopeptide repeat protein [Kofleriaceae bacterium]|nr:tetratricopeptide repeat protein [Kofleriaceae bacterium]